MKRVSAVLLAVALLLSLWGCGGKADMSFTAVLPRDVASLDPQTASGTASSLVIGSIFEGLCRLDGNGRTLPGVASRWEHNRDHTEFTFHLRKAFWSDGSQVTADDFVFGVLRALRPETKTSSLEDLFLIRNARAFHAGEAEDSELGIRAKNDRVLIVQLETGFPDFPALTAGSHYMPCRQDYFESCAGHYGLSAEYLLTNGPFTFPHIYAWNTDYGERSISLVRSDTYKGEQPTVASSLTYLIDYSDEIDADPLGALQRGDVDVLILSEQEAKAAEELGCTTLTLDDGVLGLLLNPQADKLNYVGMRELFLRTVDRQTLMDLDVWNTVDEAMGIMPGCVHWNEEDYYASDEICFLQQDDSKTEIIPSLLELLQLDRIPSITVLCPDDSASVDLANHFLISWNGKLGNAFNIRPMPEREVAERVEWGEYEAALYTLRAGGATPYNVLAAFTESAFPSLMKSWEFDSTLRSMSFDRESFRDLETILRDNCVFYPLFLDRSYYVLAPGVSNVFVSPDQRIDFSQARKKK